MVTWVRSVLTLTFPARSVATRRKLQVQSSADWGVHRTGLVVAAVRAVH